MTDETNPTSPAPTYAGLVAGTDPITDEGCAYLSVGFAPLGDLKVVPAKPIWCLFVPLTSIAVQHLGDIGSPKNSNPGKV